MCFRVSACGCVRLRTWVGKCVCVCVIVHSMCFTMSENVGVNVCVGGEICVCNYLVHVYKACI